MSKYFKPSKGGETKDYTIKGLKFGIKNAITLVMFKDVYDYNNVLRI